MMKRIAGSFVGLFLLAASAFGQTPTTYNINNGLNQTLNYRAFQCGGPLCTASVPIDTLGNPLAGPVGTPPNYAITVQGNPAGAPVPVNCSIGCSGSGGGSFTPSTSGARGTPFTVNLADTSGILPTGNDVIVSNTGTNDMFCNVNGIAATTADQLITTSGWFEFGIPSGITTLHCFAVGGTTTANMLGGSGPASGIGSGGSGGGGGEVTQGTTPWIDSVHAWGSGDTALGSPSAYGTSPGAVVVPGVNAFVTNSVAVTGTFWQATQPISAASMPLPGNAAAETGGNLAAVSMNTSATTTDIGSPGSTACASDTSSCNLNQQNQRVAQRITSLIGAVGSPFQAGASIGNTMFASTQSGAWTVTAVGSAANGAAVSGNPVLMAGSDGTDARTISTDSSGRPNVNINGTVLISGTIAATQSGSWSMTANAGTNLNTSLLALETGGNLATTATNTGTIAGAVSASVMQSNTKQVNGVTTLAGAGAVGTGSQRVAVGQDTTTIAGSAPGTAGTPSPNVVSVQGVSGGTPAPVTSAPSSSSSSGLSPSSTSALASNQTVKGSAGNLYSFEVSADSTLSAAAWWIMVYNATTAPADGAVTPAKCYAQPAGVTSYAAAFYIPVQFSSGITIGVSTTGCFTKTASAHGFISGDAQ